MIYEKNNSCLILSNRCLLLNNLSNIHYLFNFVSTPNIYHFTTETILMTATQSKTYTIKLPQFEGPFDLLLFFIQRDELDIHDIPIAKLTNDFLDYMHKMELLNIELASEFILVAATLMRIKAKMLLPRKEVNEEGEEIDPRAELVQRLLEYKKFKAVVEDLKTMEEVRSKRFGRGNNKRELQRIANQFSSESDLESINLYKLMKTFNRILQRVADRAKKEEYSIVKHPYTIKQQKNTLQNLITTHQKANFETLFDDCDSRIHAIFRFLAILEMVQEKIFSLKIGLGFNNFWLLSLNDGVVDLNLQK